jgi:hypothetical protein
MTGVFHEKFITFKNSEEFPVKLDIFEFSLIFPRSFPSRMTHPPPVLVSA